MVKDGEVFGVLFDGVKFLVKNASVKGSSDEGSEMEIGNPPKIIPSVEMQVPDGRPGE